MICLEE